MTAALKDQTTMLGKALWLAQKGFHVFPLMENGRLPAVSAPAFKASNDPDKIRAMWSNKDPVMNITRVRDYNIGIYTGRFQDDKHLLAIDVDVKNGKKGDESLSNLDLEYGTPGWLDTWSHRTLTGGEHYLFVTDTPTRNSSGTKLGKDIDTRGEGGYVIAPGSKIDGKEYQLTNTTTPKPAPKWLVQRVGAPRKKDETNVIEFLDTKPAIDRALTYLQSREPAIEGAGGDEHTLKTAMAIGDIGISQLTCLEMMHKYWNEKCDPPWDYEELATKVENAYSYRSSGVGSKDPENDFEPLDDMPDPVEEAQKPTRILTVENFSDVKASFHNDHLIENWIDKKAFSVIYGDSNVGKTFVALSLAYSISTGTPWADNKSQQAGVIYVAAEASNGVRPRVVALRKHHNRNDIPAGIIASPVDLLHGQADLKAIIASVQTWEQSTGNKCQLLIIDTLSRVLSGGDENSSTDMGALVKNIDALRDELNCHLMLVHHSGKNAAKGARGHSLLRAATDTEISVENGIIRATKQRDMEFAPQVPFELKSVELHEMPDGEVKTSAVAIVGKAMAENDFEELEMTPAEKEAFDALVLAMGSYSHTLNGVKCVPFEGWVDCFKREMGLDGADVVNTLKLRRSRLVKKQVVRKVGQRSWAPIADFEE